MSSRREALLTRLLEARGWQVESRQTLPMMGGDVVEITLWRLSSAAGRVTLAIVAEIGFGAAFPPVIRAVAGHPDLDTARSAEGEETLLDEKGASRLAAFVDGLGKLAS